MYPEPTLQERVAASLQMLGLRKIPPEEGAAHLNGHGGPADPDGRLWTPESLAAFMDEHDIRPERVPDLSHFRPVNNDRSWMNSRNILRTIERGFDDEQDGLRWVIANDNPYDPGLYARWLAFARRERPTPNREECPS